MNILPRKRRTVQPDGRYASFLLPKAVKPWPGTGDDLDGPVRPLPTENPHLLSAYPVAGDPELAAALAAADFEAAVKQNLNMLAVN